MMRSRGSGSRYASLLLGLAISALFLWLAAREVDFQELMHSLSSADTTRLAPMALALLLCFWLKAVRWRLLIRSVHAVATRRLIEPMMIGFAANNVLPFRVGELIRVLTAGRLLRISRTELLASIVVERILDAFSVALLTITALVVIRSGAPVDADRGGVLSAAVAATLLSGATLLFVFGLVGKDLTALARFSPSRFRNIVAAMLSRFVVGLEPVSNRARAVPVLLLSIAQWGLIAVCMHLAMDAVGIDVSSYAIAPVVLGLVVLGISLPGAPAFVGATEYAFVLGLGFFDVPPGDALAAAIFYHVMMFVAVTSAGALCWLRYSMRRGDDPSASSVI